MLKKVNMPPQTRRITKEENRNLRSKKVHPIKSVQISLTRCDKKKVQSPSPRSKLVKKDIIKSDGKPSTPSKSPKSNIKQNQYSPVATTSRKPTKLEKKFIDEKRTTVINDIRDRKSDSKSSSSSPKSVIKGGQSPKKSVTLANHKSPRKTASLANLKQSPKKPATLVNPKSLKKPALENVKPCNIKQTIAKICSETSKKSEIRIRKPLLKKNLSKGSRLRKHMKLGRIYINPTFPLRSVLKRHLHSGDKEENQGQFVTLNSTTKMVEQNNNNIGTFIEPKIVLRKIDEAEKPIRKMRRMLRKL